MEDIRVYAEAVDWLSLMLSVALVVLPTLIILALTGIGGAAAVKAGRALWLSMRVTVDEPGDPVVMLVAGALKQKPELISEFLVRLFDTTFEPPAEVNIGDAAHQ